MSSINVEWLDNSQDREMWGVCVKLSHLLNFTEQGLYATKSFDIDDKIAPYLGEQLSLVQRRKRYGNKWGPYVYFKPWGHPSIDAIYYRCAAACANDGTWIKQGNVYVKRDPDLSNCCLNRGWLKAVKPITQGQEILLNYGHSYWKNRYTGKYSDIVRFEQPDLITLRPNLDSLNVNLDSQNGGNLDSQNGGNLEFLNVNLTPVEKVNSYWFKRDDLYQIGGARGGKARACLSYILNRQKNSTVNGIVSGGSRSSPQVQIVGYLAKYLNLPARLHIPQGIIPDYIKKATYDLGHEVIQWFPGFNHVISARVKQDAMQLDNWLEVPFGMEFQESIDSVIYQTSNLPLQYCKRIIVPVGSGMTLVGIIKGVRQHNSQIPIIGIIVGRDPTPILDRWLPPDWRDNLTLINCTQPYKTSIKHNVFQGIDLDPIYEAKMLPYIKPYDLLWLVGHR